MDKPDKITAEDQKNIWHRFELQVQEFRSKKELRDSEFKTGLDKLKDRLSKLNC
jgi:hypothetical protein